MSDTLERDSGETTGPTPPGDQKTRIRPKEPPYKVIALVGLTALVGFVVYVVVHTQTSHHPTTFPVTRPSSLPRGADAPVFSLPRLGGGADVGLGTAHGLPTMVNFFASWCADCRAELHAVAEVATQASGKVAVIGIDTSDPDATTAAKLLADAGATYPVGVDPDAHIATKYKITGLPVTYFLSASGRVEGVAFGPQTERSLERWVEKLTSPARTDGAPKPKAAGSA